MFRDASLFNNNGQALTWSTSNVLSMNAMFNGALSFNQNISSWNTSSVIDMAYMFQDASSFNQSLKPWSTSNVLYATNIFCGCPVFGQTAKYPTLNFTPDWGCPISPNSMIMNIYAPAGSNTMTLPFGGISSINVDWGNSLISSYGPGTTPTRAYTGPANYTITIGGSASSFGNSGSYYTGVSLISSVSQWGTLGFSSLSGAFTGATNLVVVPTDIPSSVLNLYVMFNGATTFNQSLNNWNTSNVINMGGMFASANAFNQPLDNWSTSNVLNMTGMFSDATAFNRPLNNWNTSSVTSMNSMFASANAFNQPLDNWSTSNVLTMNSMFADNNTFNSSIYNWNTSNVRDMSNMFTRATAFDKPLNNWDTSNVSSMNGMFTSALLFNQNISGWNVTSVISADLIFCFCPEMLAHPEQRPNITISYISSCS
jgi:surface protein